MKKKEKKIKETYQKNKYFCSVVLKGSLFMGLRKIRINDSKATDSDWHYQGAILVSRHLKKKK